MNLTKYSLVFAAVFGASLVPAMTAHASPGHDSGSLPFGKPGNPGDVDRTIELTVDEMSYGTEEIRVSEGETVRFVIANPSGIDHDFTIGDDATQEAHRADMMKMMGSPSGMEMHDDPNAAFLAPGETAELIWTFSKAGDFSFACNVPGHYEAGMHGTISVTHSDS